MAVCSLKAPTIAIVIIGIAVAAAGGSSRAASSGRLETAGGLARTWSNPKIAGGRAGKMIARRQTVRVECRVRGFKVSDGDIWWYRLASKPWNGRFYATADAFYNNGKTSGELAKTPLVDRAVPRC